MNFRATVRRGFLAAALISGLLHTACTSPPVAPVAEPPDRPTTVPTETPASAPAESAAEMTSPPTISSPELDSTLTSSSTAQSDSGMEIPPGWHTIPVAQPALTGTIFVQQDPALLATFDDPALAVPADFAAGALLFTPLPSTADPDALREDMEANLTGLADEDFVAMLVGADKAGLISLSAVNRGNLQRAYVSDLGEKPAIALEGTIHFMQDQPPILQGRIWLAWTNEAFVVFYELASDSVWSQVGGQLDATRLSLVLP